MEKQYKILLVEDNPGDARLAEEAFYECKEISFKITIVDDGEKALSTLHKDKFDIIILDLNIPKIDGRQVLIKIKNNEKLKAIPVVILTTSKSPEDIEFCYENCANSYINKSFDFDEFSLKINNFMTYWFETVELNKE